MESENLHTPSSFAGTVIAIRETLEDADLDGAKILLEAGIDIEALSNPEIRVPAESINALVNLATEKTADPAFGLAFAEHVHPTSYHALGMALLFSESPRAFLQRLVRYYALISTMEDMSLTETDNMLRLSAMPRMDYNAVARRVHGDGWAGMVLKFMRMMYKPSFAPVKVELAGVEPPGLRERYMDFFRAPVYFDSEFNSIYFDSTDLDARMPTANAELARQNDSVVVQFLSRYGESDLVGIVKSRIIELLPSGACSREVIASSLNMSVRTLHSRLEEQGASYQQILDEVRQELSAQYLQRGELSVTEISFLMGFSDSSNFSRVFKRWHGLSPKAYRNQHCRR